MKMRFVLLFLLIMGQLAWLGWQFARASAELAAAPRVVVAARLLHGSSVAPVEPISHRDVNYPYIVYTMDSYTQKAIKKAPKNAQLHFTLEVALRESQPPMATQLFVNGAPLAEAVEALYRGEVPGHE